MISEHELQKEIEFANQECSAYRMLVAAFDMLYALTGEARYQIENAKYTDRLMDCEEYFTKLADFYSKHFVPVEEIRIEE